MQKDKTANTAAKILPDSGSNLSKKEQVADMFNNIAGRYDFLNHFLSLGIDKSWRKKAIQTISGIQPQNILDIATGTGDLAIAASKTGAKRIVGIDIAEQMLAVGREKIAKLHLQDIITLQLEDSAELSFSPDTFDAVTCAYGVRNFEFLEKGLREMNRVMRPDGRLAILEFSRPTLFPIKQGYNFYFKYILPRVGGMVSKNSRAYTYLHESAMAFPEGKDFCKILEACGFKNAHARPLALGITTLYTAEK